MILAVLAVGFTYSAPNLYPDGPAVQTSGASMALQVTQADTGHATRALTDVGITVKTNSLSKKGGLIRLVKQDDQLSAKEMVRWALGDDYVVALNPAQITPEWLCKLGGSPVKLGLDLSSGVHFLLGVDMDKVVSAHSGVYESEAKSLLCREHVHYHSLSIQDRAIQLGFTDGESPDKARSLIAKDFRDFEVMPEECNGLQVLRVILTQAKLAEIREYSTKQNLTTIRNRVNELGVSEPLVQHQGANRIVVGLPGVQDTVEAERILSKAVNLEFHPVTEPDALKSATETSEFRGSRRPPVPLECGVITTGGQVIDANASFGENSRPQVNIRLDGHGGEPMNRITRSNIGRSIVAMFIEQKPVTRHTKQVVGGVEKEVAVPAFKEERWIINPATTQSPLDNQFRIIDLDDPGESSELAPLLRVDGLTTPVYFTEERTISPSLEADNTVKGVDTSPWGMLFVSLSIIVIYRFLGVTVIVTLVSNMIMLVVLMSVLGATLTPLGIAGIALTMGMVVNASVLVFPRIREELTNDISVQRAIHEGSNRAFIAILDANLASLLVDDILYAMGTGPTKGLAMTVSLGIITSMFTAVMVTRIMINLIFGGRDFEKLWT